LRNEKIEIIRYSEAIEEFIANSLSPAKVSSVTVDEERNALVIVPDNMLSLAIGREGQNVRLAAKLTQYRVDIKSESQMRELEAELDAIEAVEADEAVEVVTQEVTQDTPETSETDES
jgi:transcription termination/antitermination protein NusA